MDELITMMPELCGGEEEHATRKRRRHRWFTRELAVQSGVGSLFYNYKALSQINTPESHRKLMIQ